MFWRRTGAQGVLPSDLQVGGSPRKHGLRVAAGTQVRHGLPPPLPTTNPSWTSDLSLEWAELAHLLHPEILTLPTGCLQEQTADLGLHAASQSKGQLPSHPPIRAFSLSIRKLST